MLERYLILWLIGFSLFAFQAPAWLGWDPFASATSLLPYLIAVTMFSVGWVLPRAELIEMRRRWHSVMMGTAVQYATMPALAYLVGRACGLSQPLLVGTILVGCVPGAMASNVLTLAARGHVTYSLCLTTSATLLSPLAVPLVMSWFLGRVVEFDVREVFTSLLVTVVLPVIVGHLSGHFVSRRLTWTRDGFVVVANLSILLIIGIVVAVNRDRLQMTTSVLIGALLAINVLGYVAGYGAGTLLRLPPGMRRALTLEIGMQNAGVGVSLAHVLFPDSPQTLIPPALYTFGCMLTGTLLANLWGQLGRPADLPDKEVSAIAKSN